MSRVAGLFVHILAGRGRCVSDTVDPTMLYAPYTSVYGHHQPVGMLYVEGPPNLEVVVHVLSPSRHFFFSNLVQVEKLTGGGDVLHFMFACGMIR